MARVLVADDDEPLRLCLQELLEPEYQVVSVSDGQAALAGDPQTFDAVIADLRMPKMGGDDLKKAMDRRSIDVPLILISAEPDLAEIAASIGAFAFLAKPIDQEALRDTVARALEPKSLPHPLWWRVRSARPGRPPPH